MKSRKNQGPRFFLPLFEHKQKEQISMAVVAATSRREENLASDHAKRRRGSAREEDQPKEGGMRK
jgi:hypothetical protein